jgi:hypothetical protein
MSESQHTVTVINAPNPSLSVPDPVIGTICQAVCSCGWSGPIRGSEAMDLGITVITIFGVEKLLHPDEAEDSLEQDTGIPGVDAFDLWADR